MTAGGQTASRVTIDVLEDGGPFAGLAEDVRRGLTAPLKELDPKYLYDERGSRLFEEITGQPEYYPTRAERAILVERAPQIVAEAGAEELVELGAGAAEKTRLLLDAMRDAGALDRYVPVDICEGITVESARRLTAEYEGLEVHGLVCDFVDGALGDLPSGSRRLIALLGGTIGNLRPDRQEAFLARLASLMDPEDRLLLGTDLVKDRARLEAAYDDRAGVTAAFNRNVLLMLNRELDGEFDPEAFEHVARWDARHERIDIRLRSLRAQRVRVGALDMEVELAPGEEIRTELSHKFTRPKLEHLYRAAGLVMCGWFTDPEGLYALSLAAPRR